MRNSAKACRLVAMAMGLAWATMVVGCQTTPKSENASATASPAAKPTDAAVPAALIEFDDAIEINNGVVRLAVSPSVGRAVAFGLVGGENLLWINSADIYDEAKGEDAYFNIGGDKLWAAPQPLWKNAFGHNAWPPDGILDGSPWTLAEQSDDVIVIQSPPSPHYGVVARRTFKLVPDKAQAVITNTLTRTQANPHPVQLWTVTQIKQPRAAVLDLAGDAPQMPEPFLMMTKDTPGKVEGFVQLIGQQGAVEWTQQGDAYAKLGTLGRWVAGVYDGLIFRQETAFDPHGAYPEASSVQVYREGSYTELELLSPLVQLAPGETLRNTVTWALIKLDEGFEANAFLLAADPD